MGAQSWVNTCGVCHVGGGQMEYNRDLADYGTAGEGTGDTYVLKYARPDDAATAGIDESSWNNVSVGNMSASNKGEMDCLMCHLDGSNAGSAWMKTLGCGPANPIGPMTDPTCSGTPMYPGTRTVDIGDGVNNYDMYNRNFALKQRRMDLQASMGAGAVGVFTGSDLTGIDWGATAVKSGGPALTAGQCISGTVAYNDGGGCIDYSYAAYTGGACAGNYAAPYVVNDAVIADCIKVVSTKIATSPKSENCSVCHARDDNTMGLPGMMAMKTGFGNYGLIHDPSNPLPSGNMGASSDLDTDNGAGAVNDDYWFDFGCKTGMGKRAHKIGDTGDYIGPNARYGMSMFLPGTLDMDPLTTPNAGDPVPGKMPDIDVHDAAGMQCATCHYAIGDEDGTGYIDIPATTSHGYAYPAERIYAMDHQFAQADSLPDTKGKNNLDAKLQCGVCHIERTHPNLTDNGGTLAAPTPSHTGLVQNHLEFIGCVTCHVPETYSAPGRLKYRDWTAGFARGTFRNQLDWNFNLVQGNHNTVPSLRKWATKNGETKIYPFLPSLLPTWYEMIPNSGNISLYGDLASVEGNTTLNADGTVEHFDVYGSCTDNDPATTLPTEGFDCTSGGSECIAPAVCAQTKYPSPVKNRDLQMAGEAVRDAHPEFDIRLNGGNTVPLFDGFQIVDSWEIDTLAEIDAMMAEFAAQAADGPTNPNNDGDARYVSFLNVIQADFDVTHGIVPKEWALGGSERGGCVSCHSSKKMVLGVDPMDPATFMVPNPTYSPFSIGFFEGYTQPIDNKGLPNFGVGGSDVVKNWMALFADFDVTAMCGMNNPLLTATDGMGGMLNPNTDAHNFYFNPLTGAPNMTATCDANSWFSNNFMLGTAGWCMDMGAGDQCWYDQNGDGQPETAGGPCTPSMDGAMGTDSECNQTATLQVGIGMMTKTFDAAMGFPSGTAAQMGMYDGVAGIQGFALKELQTGGTLGCNGFAGPISFSPMPGQSVNNCMPNYADPTVAAAVGPAAATYAGLINGTCAGAAPPVPGTCSGGFRGNGPCFTDADCSGAMTDLAEIGHNPFGLIMDRATAKSHFKIDLEQGWKVPGDPTTPKVKWSAGGDKNPNNPAHVNKWDQAQYCYDWTTGVNPMMPNVVACASLTPGVGSDGSGRMLIATAQSANQFLGYPEARLASLMDYSTLVGDDLILNDGMHLTHGLLLGVAPENCLNCHTSNADYAMVDGATGTSSVASGSHDWTYAMNYTEDGCNQWAIDNADGIIGTADDYVCIDVVPGVPTGFGSCATTCHPTTDTVTPGNPTADSSSVTGVDVTASVGALHAISDNNIIKVSAQRSSCTGAFNSECSYGLVIVTPADCSVVGGTTADGVFVLQGTNGQPCTVSVDVTDTVTAETVNSGNVTVIADGTLDNPGPVNSDVASFDNGDGTCTVSATDLDGAVQARIYWGNRESQSMPATDLTAAGGVTNYCVPANVRIKLYDASHNVASLNL